ncbi:hypothetical protein AB4341_17670 [Vibrio breoganii]
MIDLKSTGALAKVSNDSFKKLFSTIKKPSNEELKIGYQHTRRLVNQGNLNTSTVSLYGQHILAHLCVLSPDTRRFTGNVLEVEGFWPQAKTMFVDRNDTITCQILLSDIEQLAKANLSDNLADITSDILQLTQEIDKTKLRGKRFYNEHVAEFSGNYNEWLSDLEITRNSWLSDKFEKFQEYSVSLPEHGNLIWVNKFFNSYVQRGLVWKLDFYTSKSHVNQVKDHVPDCKVHHGISDQTVYVVMQLSNAVVVYNTSADEGVISELGKLVDSHDQVVVDLPNLKYNLSFMLSKTGFWQYRASYMLKNGTKFSPRRIDYMVK